jgi:hypothetical protein
MTCINRTAIVVKPRQPFLDWLRWADPAGSELSLQDLQEDPSVYLIRNCETDEDIRKNLAEVFGEIFEEQLDGWYRVPSLWPNQRDMEAFSRWFEWRAHTIVFDLCGRPIRREHF